MRMITSPLREIIPSFEDIPSIPVYVQRLLTALEEENLAARDLQTIISKDPVMSSRILRVANSSFFGMTGKVGTLDRALVLLGTRFVQALALSVSIVDTIAYNRFVGQLRWEGFWLHSFACAWVSNRMVQMGVYPVVKDESFICGLLHDLGKPMLWSHQAPLYQEVVHKINMEKLETHVAETDVFGMHHGEIGGEMGSWWKFPASIQSAIQSHHDENPDSSAARLVKIADWVVNSEGFSDGLNSDDAAPTIHPEIIGRVSHEVLTDLAGELRAKQGELAEVVSLLNSGVGK